MLLSSVCAIYSLGNCRPLAVVPKVAFAVLWASAHVIALAPTMQDMGGFSPPLLKMEILSGELAASALSLARLCLSFTGYPWPSAVGIFSVQNAWNKLKVMSQPIRGRFSQHSTCTMHRVGRTAGLCWMLAGKASYKGSQEQQGAKEAKAVLGWPTLLSRWFSHIQSGMQVWQLREDGANIDPCSEDDEKPRRRVTLEWRYLTAMINHSKQQSQESQRGENGTF